MTERQQIAFLLKSTGKDSRSNKENEEAPAASRKSASAAPSKNKSTGKKKPTGKKKRAPLSPAAPQTPPRTPAPEAVAAAPTAAPEEPPPPPPPPREVRLLMEMSRPSRPRAPAGPRCPSPASRARFVIDDARAAAAADAALGRPSSAEAPPACWRPGFPAVGAAVAIHAFPDNDPANTPRWYVARVVRVLTRKANGKGRVKVLYDADGTYDWVVLPDVENCVEIDREFASSEALAPLRARAGGCCLAGASVVVEAPAAAAIEAAEGSDGDLAFRVLSGGAAAGADAGALRAYKVIADGLLAGLRGRNCLYQHVFGRHAWTLVASRGATVIGGATFRLVRLGAAVVAEVTTISVAAAAAGERAGTRLSDRVKALASRHAAARGAEAAFVVAAAENSVAATSFWAKQRLIAGPAADHLFAHLDSVCLEYTNATHVCARLDVDTYDEDARLDVDGGDDALLDGLGRLSLAPPAAR